MWVALSTLGASVGDAVCPSRNGSSVPRTEDTGARYGDDGAGPTDRRRVLSRVPRGTIEVRRWIVADTLWASPAPPAGLTACMRNVIPPTSCLGISILNWAMKGWITRAYAVFCHVCIRFVWHSRWNCGIPQSLSHRKKTRRAGAGPATIWLKAAMKQIYRVWRAAYIHGKSESGECKEAITFRAAASCHSLWEVQNAES